jgi:hypothetical protein
MCMRENTKLPPRPVPSVKEFALRWGISLRLARGLPHGEAAFSNRLLHEPTVTDNQRLTGKGVRLEPSK